MRLTRLGVANLLLFGAIGVLLVAFGPQLRWAAGAIGDYWNHRFPPLRESVLRTEALEILLEGGDLDRAERLLRQSLRIEPYTVAVMLLGEVYLARGEPERALEQYRSYTRIDPYHLDSRLRVAQILAAQGRTGERREALAEALRVFRAEAELQRPHPDPDAPAAANEKALTTYRGYLTAIERLEAELAATGED